MISERGRKAEALPGDTDASVLTERAAQCRRLAAGISDRDAAEVLRSMARDYEEGARLGR